MSLWGKRGPVTRQVGHGHEALTQCRGEEARCQVVADVMYLLLVLDVVPKFDPDSNFQVNYSHEKKLAFKKLREEK